MGNSYLYPYFWAELCPPEVHKSLNPSVTVFGNRIHKKVIKVK